MRLSGWNAPEIWVKVMGCVAAPTACRLPSTFNPAGWFSAATMLMAVPGGMVRRLPALTVT